MIIGKNQACKLLMFLIALCSSSVLASSDLVSNTITEYSYVPAVSGKQGYQHYLDELGAPKIRLVSGSSDDNKSHWTEVVDENNRVIQRFSDKYRVSILGETRYQDKAMLLVKTRLKKCKKTTSKKCRKNYLFGSNVKTPKLAERTQNGSFDSAILENSNLMYLGPNGLLIQNVQDGTSKTIPTPFEITDGTIGTDIYGNWLAVAVSDDGEVLVADENGWDVPDLALSAHGDRRGVLSIYPQERGIALIVVYRYINEYNKGLYLLDYDMSAEKINTQGWLFNSEEINVGFDPEVYFKHASNEVVVTATNSSIDNRYLTFTLPIDRMAGLLPEIPEHVLSSGFNEEKLGSFIIGGGIRQVDWLAQSKAKNNDVTFAEVDYRIADTLFASVNLEARLGEAALTINYIKNRAEDAAENEIDDSVNHSITNTLAKEASSRLFSAVDFHGLLDASSSLRLLFEHGKTKGIAEVDLQNQEKEFTRFTTEYNRVGLLVMRERGLYLGGDYVHYSMPSAVGFKNSNGGIDFSSYDPDFKFTSLRFVTGYDALAYAKRYETNYSRWYWAGGINAGLGWATLSDQIKEDAKQTTGKNKIADLPFFFVVGGELELGYVWQKRSKTLWGAGYSSAIGYRVNGNYLGDGQSKYFSNDEDNSLSLEFSRIDVLHGLFFKANLFF